MSPKVQRLDRGWEAALERRLLDDPVVNLFPIGFARMHALDRARWYAMTEGSEVAGVVLLVPDRLAVPWCPDPEHASAIGRYLQGRVDPCMLVGPRAAGDALWSAWAGDGITPQRCYDQRLFALRERPPGKPVPGFRRARLDEWRTIARYSGQMEHEDLGRNPREVWPDLHDRVVRERIRSGRTWVIVRDGELLFQVNIGTALDLGAQIGGTWVPPGRRGEGLATRGVRALCRHLLGHHPVVTLHVNEANTPAVRVYDKVGFRRHAPFRLITV